MSNPVQFCIATMFDDVNDYLPWARLVEDSGFDMIGYGDTQNLLPDAFVALTAMAIETERVKLCTTVSNPVTRHPAVAASAMTAIQKLSGGRTRFGIGTGDSAVRNIGARAARVDEIETYCRTFQALCRGETITHDDYDVHLSFDTEPVPLILAAEGPRMMRLAGRVADGVIFGNGLSDEVIADNIARIEAAAVEAGRDPADIELWWMVKIVFADSEEQAWHDWAGALAGGANHAFAHSLEGKFVPPEHVEGVRRLREGYRSYEHHQIETTHNASLVIDNGLTEFLGRRYLVAGPSERIVERIGELADQGATNFIVAGVFGDPMGYTRQVAEQVLPAFG